MRLPLYYIGFGFAFGFMLCWLMKSKCNASVPASEKDSSAWYTPEITFIEGGHIPDTVTKYKTQILHDTVEIVKDYQRSIFYSDTVKTVYGNIVIKDSVRYNRIQDRQTVKDLKIPDAKNKLYGGVDFSVSPLITGFGPSVFFQSGNIAIKASLLFNPSGNKIYSVGLYKKFSIKK